MKLKNKILTVAAPVAVIAAVTPITLVSCNKHTPGTIDTPDLLKWKPSGEKIADQPEGYTVAEMQKTYFEKIGQNKDILAEDITATFQNLVKDIADGASSKVEIINLNTTTGMVSIKMELKTKIVVENEEYASVKTMEIENIPFAVEWLNEPEHGHDNHFYVLSKWRTYETLKDQTGWTLKVKVVTGGETLYDTVYNHGCSETEQKDAANVLRTLVVESYYMDACTKKA